MPYATNNQVSTDTIVGGIAITQEQYRQAIDGMCDGLELRIIDGAMQLVEPAKITNTEPTNE